MDSSDEDFRERHRKKDRSYLELLSSSNYTFGRMGRVAERILKKSSTFASLADRISQEEFREIHIFGECVYEIMQLTSSGFLAKNRTISQTIQYYREEITEISSMVKRRYIRRVHSEGGEKSQVRCIRTYVTTRSS